MNVTSVPADEGYAVLVSRGKSVGEINGVALDRRIRRRWGGFDNATAH